MIRSALSLAVIATLIASCAPQQRAPLRSFKQALQEAPGNAQPSKIVAREIELLNRAREIGQPQAAGEFALPTAIVLSAQGEAPASQFLAMAGAGATIFWQPKTVWVSCNGRSAVSDGRFETPAGLVGDYMTTWVLDRGSGEYFWLHNAAALDDPQPPPKPPQPEPGPNEIVVDGLIAVKGHVADCGSRPDPLPAASSPLREARSQDGTLAWRWSYTGGERVFELHAWTEGEWQIVMDRRWPAEAL